MYLFNRTRFFYQCAGMKLETRRMLITQDDDNERNTLTLILILLFKHGVTCFRLIEQSRD